MTLAEIIVSSMNNPDCSIWVGMAMGQWTTHSELKYDITINDELSCCFHTVGFSLKKEILKKYIIMKKEWTKLFGNHDEKYRMHK